MTKGSQEKLVIIVLGASGDLAKKKTFPALFGLYKNELLPENTTIIGYARSDLSDEDFKNRFVENIEKKTSDQDKPKIKQFLKLCSYVSGQYDKAESFKNLDKIILERTGVKNAENETLNRIYYLALPPSVYASVCQCIKENCWTKKGYNRMVIEKPFGKDLKSSDELHEQLSKILTEDEIFRIDHYLGKEMIKAFNVLRFGNIFFNAVWNRKYISNIQITFKEKFGAEGRGGYFDEYGMIRDVMQNHMMQMLIVVAMEKPVTLDADDHGSEKTKVLRYIAPVKLEDTLLGQYVAEGDKIGYTDDETVPKGSLTETYAATVLYINNDRWEGVPFILKAGKALDSQKSEIRIQFREVPSKLFSDLSRNELVIRVQPDEALYLKFMTKKPGLTSDIVQSELDLSYHNRFMDLKIPDAYESLILDVLKGDHNNFVRADELREAWRIWTPLLDEIQSKKIKPKKYKYGSRGPEGEAEFPLKYGFVRGPAEYEWPKHSP